MIARNEKHENPEAKRQFTQILHEAKKHWREIENNPATKTARGALATDDRAIIALLSFDGVKNQLSLITRLPVKKEMDTAALRQIIRYQNLHRNLCGFLTVDDECKIVSVIANAPVYDEKSSMAVDCIFKAACTILNDNGLNELLN